MLGVLASEQLLERGRPDELYPGLIYAPAGIPTGQLTPVPPSPQ
jgi:hypothetical protein